MKKRKSRLLLHFAETAAVQSSKLPQVFADRLHSLVICQRFTQTKVLVLTTFDDDEYVTQAMGFGVMGYLLKDTR